MATASQSMSIVSFLLIFLFIIAQAENTNQGHVSAPAPAPAPIDCGAACAVRCSLTSRPRLCKRECGVCCERCHCVLPGTAGGDEASCPCYAHMTTRGGRKKCP